MEFMVLAARFSYALRLTAVGGAALGLTIAILSSDAVAVLPISYFDALLSPLYYVVIFGVSFAVAPWVAERLTYEEDRQLTPRKLILFGVGLLVFTVLTLLGVLY